MHYKGEQADILGDAYHFEGFHKRTILSFMDFIKTLLVANHLTLN